MIIGELQAGRWVIPRLIGVFEQALVSRLDPSIASEWPLFIKTAAYYRILDDLELKFNVEFQTSINGLSIDVNNKFTRASVPGYEPLPQTQVSKIEVDRIWTCLVEYDRSLSEIFNSTITNTLVVSGCSFKAASSPLIFGCLIASQALMKVSKEELALSLVHELAHHELFLINTTDRLVAAEGDQNFKYAPLQKKNRPTIGRLHSAHVLYRMIQFQESIEINADKNKQLLEQTCQTLKSDELTQLANMMIEKVYSQCLN